MNIRQQLAEYFSKSDRVCGRCLRPFDADSFHVMHTATDGGVTVRVTCSHCQQPLGVALVRLKSPPAAPVKSKKLPLGWTRKDAVRLKDHPTISYDDVIEAHEFFSNLGPDWARLLPSDKT